MSRAENTRARNKEGALDLDEQDPLELGLENSDIEALETEHENEVRDRMGVAIVMPSDMERYVEQQVEQGELNDWVREIGFGEIKGLEGQFRTNKFHTGTYKQGYIDQQNQVFVQAPKRGDTFQETLERVQTWKNNKEVLDEADRYLEQILEREGTETVETELREITLDYDFLRENEELLRKDIENGIITPSKDYQVIISSQRGEPIPLMVSEYRQDMMEHDLDVENPEQVKKRKEVLGTYMDALINEGVFESAIGDYNVPLKYQKTSKGTRNMFYDPEKDRVGLTDLGEHINGQAQPEIPEIDIKPPYKTAK